MRIITQDDVLTKLTNMVEEARERGEQVDCVEIDSQEKRRLVTQLHRMGESSAANSLQLDNRFIYIDVPVVVK